MSSLIHRCVASARRFKTRFFGERLWSGPGRPGAAPQTPIADVSFHLPGGEAAVLLIHGLTGTPTEMRFIGKSLAQAGFTVHGVQLAGHCGSEAHLLHTGWRDWYGSVEAAFLKLKEQYREVYVAGLSMGAVLGLLLAARHPGKVQGVALYSTTLTYDGWSVPKLAFLLPLLLAMPFGARYRFVETFPYGIKDSRLRARVVASMESGDSAAAGTLGLPGACLTELRALVRVTKSEMARVQAPTLILHAREDDLTSVRNAEYVAAHVGGPVRTVLLDDCYHMITVDRQRHDVVRETVDFFREISQVPMARRAAE